MLSIASGALATNGSRGSVTAFTGGSAILAFTRIRGTTTSTWSSLTINYAYDPLYRLTTANYSSGKVFTYTYDAVGNQLSDGAPAGVTTYAYDNANRLTTINGTTTYSWDNNGNLLNNGSGVTYTYDAANRLVAQNATLYTFGYDGLGDRVQQMANGVPITYALDQAAGLTQVLSETAGAATTRYLYGLGRIDQQTSGGTDYFLGDALGSVRELANASRSVTLQKSYDPYGQALSSSGSGSSNYGFTGEYVDQTGLSYLRARYYTQRGRFLQRDTWFGSYINLADAGVSYDGSGTGQVNTSDWSIDYTRPQSLNGWAYAEGDPINLTDPSGHQSIGAQGNGLLQLCPYELGGFIIWLPCGLALPPGPGPTLLAPFLTPCNTAKSVSKSHGWVCTASCQLVDIAHKNVVNYISGTGTGSNENSACREAKSDAIHQAPRGFYARHCQCECSRN